mmetsp:Transcript_28795/g.84981  ORF Transcript_28795/g.84981 Transcript_28795/m.84981 type:complete len:255 (-) Transcript_28795:124-888(-)
MQTTPASRPGKSTKQAASLAPPWLRAALHSLSNQAATALTTAAALITRTHPSSHTLPPLAAPPCARSAPRPLPSPPRAFLRHAARAPGMRQRTVCMKVCILYATPGVRGDQRPPRPPGPSHALRAPASAAPGRATVCAMVIGTPRVAFGPTGCPSTGSSAALLPRDFRRHSRRAESGRTCGGHLTGTPRPAPRQFTGRSETAPRQPRDSSATAPRQIRDSSETVPRRPEGAASGGGRVAGGAGARARTDSLRMP